jgi:hypothetical protein
MEFDINFVSVLIAAVAGMVLGAAWYSKFLFGGIWMKLIKFTDADIKEAKKKGMGKTFAVAFVAQLLTAYVLAHFVQLTAVINGSVNVAGSLKMAFWIWLGFVATVMLTSVLWENKPWKLYFINTSYQLSTLLVMAAILSV